MNRFLSPSTTIKLLRNIQTANIPFEYEPSAHRLALLDETENKLVNFRLPVHIRFTDKVGPDEAEDTNYIILLIQSGSCAVGYFENGDNLDHKVFRSYMVRKKQGKSQVKYLKTKGKSRAGSRVRLAETMEFFENINERLKEYFEDYEIHRIAMSCSKILIPYLFSSKVATPFDKKDERIIRIPKHVHTPIYEVLLDVNRFLMKGELVYDDIHQNLVEEIMSGIGD